MCTLKTEIIQLNTIFMTFIYTSKNINSSIEQNNFIYLHREYCVYNIQCLNLIITVYLLYLLLMFLIT